MVKHLRRSDDKFIDLINNNISKPLEKYMKNKYVIINRTKVDLITQAKDALGDECHPYLERLIQHFLQDDVMILYNADIQSDIADLIERHSIDAR